MASLISFRFSRWMSEFIYLPSLPLLISFFHTSRQWLQFSMVTFIFGIMLSQLIGGPLSEKFGQRIILITAFSLAIIGTIAAIASNTLELFVIGRFIQGLGLGITISLGSVFINDAYSTSELSKAKTSTSLAYVGLLSAWFPSAAMIIGGYIYISFGWKMNFLILLFIYIALLYFVAMYIPNFSHRKENLKNYTFSQFLLNYKYLLKHPEYLAHTLGIMLISAGISAYYLSSTFIFHNYYKISTTTIGYLSLFPIVGHFFGKYISSRLTRHFEIGDAALYGLIFAVIGSISMIASLIIFKASPLSLTMPIFIYSIGAGIIEPSSSVKVMSISVKSTASAQSLLNASTSFSALTGAFLAIFVHPQNPLFLAGFISLLSISALTLFFKLNNKTRHL